MCKGRVDFCVRQTGLKQIMDIEQSQWLPTSGWSLDTFGRMGGVADLVLIFGSSSLLQNDQLIKEVRSVYPNALITGCSTAGEISGTQVTDDSLAVTAVRFEASTAQASMVKVGQVDDSYQAGKRLAESVPHHRLAHVFILSDGLKVNGSELVAGLTEHLPDHVTATGGLSGDGERFEKTVVLWEDQAQSDAVVLVGFYGDQISVGFGSLGGWDRFGPERLVTRSEGNVLYELDGQSALDLYKEYLGEHADGLPGTGLLFPLCLRSLDKERGVVRTILAVDDVEKSMTFAGDIPEGRYAQLMKANFNRLIDGATGAARTSYQAVGSLSPELSILISCVGRKMVLKQRVEEEVEEVRDILGNGTALTGFYSYGEISPFTPGAACELHNQTMTITTLREK